MKIIRNSNTYSLFDQNKIDTEIEMHLSLVWTVQMPWLNSFEFVDTLM